MRPEPSIKRVSPMGHVSDAEDAAAAIHRRLQLRLNDNRLCVFVSGDHIFAAKEDSIVAQTASPFSIVGVYNRRATPVDIAGDIEAWRAAA
jgi:hypothetical protein